jgi:hypothetical protein
MMRPRRTNSRLSQVAIGSAADKYADLQSVSALQWLIGTANIPTSVRSRLLAQLLFSS